MASGIEAAALLEAHPWQRLQAPFPLYRDTSRLLIISGVGKARAAMAAFYLIQTHQCTDILNIGAAGALHADLNYGAVVTVAEIFEGDRPILTTGGTRTLPAVPVEGYISKKLYSSDRAIVNEEERNSAAEVADMADMEAAGIAQALQVTKTKGHFLKIVSDIPGDESHRDIIEAIRSLSPILADTADLWSGR